MASTYVVPQVQITQEFIATPALLDNQLPALIIGAQYDLRRFLVAAEQPLTSAVNPDGESGNAYQVGDDIAYPYPNQNAGTTVDTDYVAVFLSNLKAQYLPNSGLGSSSGDAALELVTSPSSSVYPNRVRFTTGSGTILQTANGFTRSAYLANRDAQVGDYIQITDNLNNVTLSRINGFYADTPTQDAALDPTVGTPLLSGTDGVATGTTTFTSASATFTAAAHLKKFITITGKGTFQILQVNSANSVGLSGVVATGTALVYKVGGIYNDLGNAGIQAQVIDNVPAYTWTGVGSDPGVVDITLATTDTTAYVGYPALRIESDTYTVTCTTSGSLTTARFSVASANGAFATKINQSLSAAVLTLDSAGGNTVEWDFTGSTGSPVFTLGQSWSVLLKAAVVLENPTASGTYTGAVDNTYKLTVVRGGPLYNGSNSTVAAIFSITSSNVDSSPNIQPQASQAFNVGNYGVTATFTTGPQNSQFIPGDAYYIDATAALQGAIKTVSFDNSLPSASLTLASSWTAELLLVQPTYEVPEFIDPVAGTKNWVATTSTLTLNGGVTVTDPNLVIDSALVPLAVQSGGVYIQHRDLNPTNTASIGSVTSTAAIAAVLGTVDPDNAIAQGVYEAVNNSAGQAVYFISVASDDLTGYNTALAIAALNDTVYSLVPMTFDSDIQQAVVAQVNALSTPTAAQWRIAWLSSPLVAQTLLYDLQPDGDSWLGTVSADPEALGTVYSLVTVEGATFISDGVRAGDQVLMNFSVSPDGDTISSAHTIASVRTEDSVVLATALSAPISVPTKIEVQRKYTLDEQVNNLAAIATSFSNRRVRMIFPDTCKTGTVVKQGYLLAAACAGLRSGVAPHQPLTNSEILGFTDFTETVITLSQTQLNALAQAGVWIVTQSVIGAVAYVRQQLTTDTTDVNSEEDSVTTNVDSISYGLQAILDPFIGHYNRNPDTLTLISNALTAQINYLMTQTVTATAGAQLLDGSKVVSVVNDPLFKDRINVVISLVVPAPINVITVQLQVN